MNPEPEIIDLLGNSIGDNRQDIVEPLTTISDTLTEGLTDQQANLNRVTQDITGQLGAELNGQTDGLNFVSADIGGQLANGTAEQQVALNSLPQDDPSVAPPDEIPPDEIPPVDCPNEFPANPIKTPEECAAWKFPATPHPIIRVRDYFDRLGTPWGGYCDNERAIILGYPTGDINIWIKDFMCQFDPYMNGWYNTVRPAEGNPAYSLWYLADELCRDEYIQDFRSPIDERGCQTKDTGTNQMASLQGYLCWTGKDDPMPSEEGYTTFGPISMNAICWAPASGYAIRFCAATVAEEPPVIPTLPPPPPPDPSKCCGWPDVFNEPHAWRWSGLADYWKERFRAWAPRIASPIYESGSLDDLIKASSPRGPGTPDISWMLTEDQAMIAGGLITLLTPFAGP